jgi:hypothetical protein
MTAWPKKMLRTLAGQVKPVPQDKDTGAQEEIGRLESQLVEERDSIERAILHLRSTVVFPQNDNSAEVEAGRVSGSSTGEAEFSVRGGDVAAALDRVLASGIVPLPRREWRACSGLLPA